MNNSDKAFCLFCIVTGYIAPWAFIAAGAGLSLLPTSDYWQEMAAWIVAIGFVLLCISYFYARAYNRFVWDQRNK